MYIYIYIYVYIVCGFLTRVILKVLEFPVIRAIKVSFVMLGR